jgi:tetratricopeptide (TPR) repeat protein
MLPVFALWLGLQGIHGAHERGVDLYKQKKYAEAITTLEEAVKSEAAGTTQYRESVLMIGQSYYMLSQAPKAIPWLEKLPEVNEANYMLGYAYLQAAQEDRSEAAFARLFHVPAESAAAHLLAGEMMFKQEYESQALAEVNKALALDPKLPQARYLLGVTAIYRGRFDEAEADLKQELTINPSFAMAWYRLGDVYERRDQLNEAISDLQRAVWLNPDYSGPYILLGKCYFKQRNLENAEGILRRGLAIDPNNKSAKYLLGQTLVAEGKTDEGKAILERLKKPLPSLEKP